MTASSAQQDADAKGDIFRCIANNMLFDAGLQSIGYVFMGRVFQRYPELNDEAYYLKQDIEDVAQNYKDYAIGTVITDIRYPLKTLIENYDDTVETLANVFERDILQEKGMKRRILAGSLRTYLQLEHNSVIFTLVWIYKK